MKRTSPVFLLVAVVVSLAATTATASGSTSTEERDGAALMAAVNSEQRSCRSLSAADLDKVGEYAMGLNFASSAQHEAMNARMTTMIGADGERQAHRAMGRSYSGCAAGGTSGAAGGGMMGSESSGPGTAGGYGSFGAGMMGGSPYGPAMMRAPGAADEGLGTGSVVLIALAAALLGGVAVAVVSPRLHRRPRAGSGPDGRAEVAPRSQPAT